MREEKPLGYACSKQEAFEIVREKTQPFACGANGYSLEARKIGVTLESDSDGRYYVAVTRLVDIG